MRKILLLVIATLMITVNIYAQGSLTGRVYHCGNMMAGELNQVKKEVKDISKEAKTNEEKEEVKGMEAIINAIVSTMTLTFIDDKTVEVNSVVKFDEQKAKAKADNNLKASFTGYSESDKSLLEKKLNHFSKCKYRYCWIKPN